MIYIQAAVNVKTLSFHILEKLAVGLQTNDTTVPRPEAYSPHFVDNWKVFGVTMEPTPTRLYWGRMCSSGSGRGTRVGPVVSCIQSLAGQSWSQMGCTFCLPQPGHRVLHKPDLNSPQTLKTSAHSLFSPSFLRHSLTPSSPPQASSQPA